MSKPLILGLSASLRNARSKAGAETVLGELAKLGDREAFDAYIAEQANIHLEQFERAGRLEGKPFDELYRNLQRAGGNRGLSNSEIALMSALWGAQEEGAELGFIPLPDHFPADGVSKDLDDLKDRLREADGIILATPVYFGDRSSLAQRFVDMIREDDALRADLAGKIYAGVAVGAKRNGGQETTLIYAMSDMIQLGFLGVGNDSDTTSQYGGTGHAGDIGTMPKDVYGINTAIGTGRRIASVAHQMSLSSDHMIVDQPRLNIWMLQDRAGYMEDFVTKLVEERSDSISSQMLGLVSTDIRPCIACDICPIHVGPDSEYRCIIKRRQDGVAENHDDLLWGDVLVPAVYSPKDRKGLETVYQEFMERTRYLRRGDYVFTDRLVAPLLVTDVGAGDLMELRMMTSFMRHHTILMKPTIAYMHEGKLLNPEEVADNLSKTIAYGARLTAGRLAAADTEDQGTHYQPVGYVLAVVKDREEKTMTAREKAVAERNSGLVDEARSRLRKCESAA